MGEVVVLANATMRVELSPDHGAEVIYLGPLEGPNWLGYHAWNSPLRATRSVSYGSPLLDWLSEYRGGWQELFPNAGDDCVVAGVPLPYHGELSVARWEVVDHASRMVVLRCASRLPLLLERRMWLSDKAAGLTIEETVTNESDLPVHYLWGHHPAFAVPVGSMIDLPAHAVHVDTAFDTELVDLHPGATSHWPYARGKTGELVDLRVVPQGPVERLCYLPDLAAGWMAIRTPAGSGLAMAWDVETFPHVWFWQEIGGADFPWYGRARITAIEPVSAWPSDGLANAIRRGRAHRVAGGGSTTTWLTVSLFNASDHPIERVDRDGAVHEVERPA